MELTERVQANPDWAIYVFVGCFLIVAVVKSVFEKRFHDFLYLPANNKYLKIYRENPSLTDRFSFPLSVVQIVSYSFFIHLIFSFSGILSKNNFFDFLKIVAAVSVFVLVKFMIEKGVAFLFEIEDFYTKLFFQRSAYKTYSGLFFLFLSFVLFYVKLPETYLTTLLTAIFLGIYFLIHIFSLKSFQKAISGNLFYFILYLCTLEIVPFYFAYYWLIKF
ncbi:MAG: DUF4271 domain-containing protein [Flavobacteriaceae bacterium]